MVMNDSCPKRYDVYGNSQANAVKLFGDAQLARENKIFRMVFPALMKPETGFLQGMESTLHPVL
jgi:hypothetical protein